MGRPASLVQVGGFRPALDPFATHFGLKPLALSSENWPTAEGRLMLFVCQLNLTAAPAVPPLLAGVKLITFFVNADASFGDENGANWQLRAYPSIEGLAPLAAPVGTPAVKKGFECRWEQCNDTSRNNAARTKIGGFPTEIQSEPWWDYRDHPAQPSYCFQINSEEKVGLIWGDGGRLAIARGTAAGCENQWFLDWQSF